MGGNREVYFYYTTSYIVHTDNNPLTCILLLAKLSKWGIGGWRILILTSSIGLVNLTLTRMHYPAYHWSPLNTRKTVLKKWRWTIFVQQYIVQEVIHQEEDATLLVAAASASVSIVHAESAVTDLVFRQLTS